ncbi:MarR family transcriptional regulator [Agromyces sp. CFH 90414]|uniref:MarR family transcriptional regulator n=1 Tax=Agromyces agglutinans TaxID=2662258 RepID=A0A6I2FB32_9MICO|nr:MarR family transcriptional regulator [Agromyces agglutinans]MRG59646.1 MarR family transcriptional regulator [Agromyces agglutinans]
MARDEQNLRAAVEQSAAVLTAAGFPRMPARVLMALLVADEGGLTASELAESLGVSAAAISGGVRYLRSLGIIHRMPQPGSRRERWEIFDDAWYTALAGKNSVYGSFADTAAQALDAIGDPASAGARRTREMVDFFRYIEGKMPELLADWEALRAERLANRDGRAGD